MDRLTAWVKENILVIVLAIVWFGGLIAIRAMEYV